MTSIKQFNQLADKQSGIGPNQYSEFSRVSFENLLQKLQGVKPTKSGWNARCPAHDDKNPSLSITAGEKGILLHCHAGCDFNEICRLIDIDARDLFYEPINSNTKSKPSSPGKTITDEYDYYDEQSKIVYQVVRFRPKEFRQRRPNGKGGWIWSIQGVRRVPYRLSEIIAAEAGSTIFVVEGEKDADLLASWGLVATTNVGGAGKWRDEYTEYLKETA